MMSMSIHHRLAYRGRTSPPGTLQARDAGRPTRPRPHVVLSSLLASSQQPSATQKSRQSHDKGEGKSTLTTKTWSSITDLELPSSRTDWEGNGRQFGAGPALSSEGHAGGNTGYGEGGPIRRRRDNVVVAGKSSLAQSGNVSPLDHVQTSEGKRRPKPTSIGDWLDSNISGLCRVINHVVTSGRRAGDFRAGTS